MTNLKKVMIALPIILLILLAFYFPKLNKLYKVMHLFDQDKIVYNFTHFNTIVETSEVQKPSTPYRFPKGESLVLPKEFTNNGVTYGVEEFIDSSQTMGFLVLQKDTLRYEKYFRGHTESTRHISWSVAKSFVSALMGIAIEEGHIKNIEQKVEEYLPELIGSGYEGVRIKDLLQMSTGVAFNEDYGDFNSDINRWGRSFALGGSQDEFASTLVNKIPPGTFNHYVSIDTHVLGMIIVRSTGKSLTEYMQEKLWNKIGAEYNAYWIVDGKGMEMALGGLNITLRDFAKMGQLFLRKGNWNGEQIIPEQWVSASTTPDGAHVMPGDNPNSSHSPFGYGYQWWIPDGTEGEFLARGVYNQYIYINPTTETVIVKNSANYNFNDPTNPHSDGMAHVEMFRAIARKLMNENSMVE